MKLQLLLCLLFFGVSTRAKADSFGNDPNFSFEIEFVPFGSPR
jgi:hypothetical protein